MRANFDSRDFGHNERSGILQPHMSLLAVNANRAHQPFFAFANTSFALVVPGRFSVPSTPE
jgi:hypothetical protein